MNPLNILACTALAAACVFSVPALAGKNIPAEGSAGVPAAKKTSTPVGWTDDFAAAKKLAAEKGKDLFVLFTGTDWCPWCTRLEKEVFSKKGFIEKLSEKFVPVFIDCPNDKTRLSELAAKQNENLVRRYGIAGFPAVLLTDREGVAFAQTGYRRGGPEKYLKHVTELAEKNKDSLEYRTAKTIATLPENAPNRIARLDELLSVLPFEAQVRNLDRIGEILAADPEGKLGYRAKYPFFAIVLPLKNEFRERIKSVQHKTEKDIEANNLEFTEETVNRFAPAHLLACKAEIAAIRKKAIGAQTLFPENSPEAAELKELLGMIEYCDERYRLNLAETPAAQ